MKVLKWKNKEYVLVDDLIGLCEQMELKNGIIAYIQLMWTGGGALPTICPTKFKEYLIEIKKEFGES